MQKRDFLMKCDQVDYNQVLSLLASFNVTIPCFKKDIVVDFIMFSKDTGKFKFKADEESNIAIDTSVPPMAVVPFFDMDLFIKFTGIKNQSNESDSCFHVSFFPNQKSPISSGVNINAKNSAEAYFKFKENHPDIEPFCIHDKSQL